MEAWIIILITVIIAELIISGGWFPFYFRTGIPLFRRSFRFFEQPAISPDNLTPQFIGGFGQPIIFHSICPNEIGFREKFSRFIVYSAIMRGLIRIDNSQHEVRVTGYANWYILCLIACFSSFGKEFWHVEGIVFLIFAFLFFYVLQFLRYNKIFRYLEKEHSPYFREVKK